MENSHLLPPLLFIFCWISFSVCDVRTVELLPGEDVTMPCSNFTGKITHIFWFRLTDAEFNVTRVSSMVSSDGNETLHAGFHNGKFKMTSQRSHVFLTITPVETSDFGLYLCGHYDNRDLIIFNATNLKIGEMVHGSLNPTGVLLGGLTVFLIMIIVALLVKSRIVQAAQDKRQTPQNTQSDESDSLNYAAVRLHPRTNGGRRTAERELETQVKP